MKSKQPIGRPKQEKEKIYYLYLTGWPVNKIAEKYNVSRATIYQVLKGRRYVKR